MPQPRPCGFSLPQLTQHTKSRRSSPPPHTHTQAQCLCPWHGRGCLFPSHWVGRRRNSGGPGLIYLERSPCVQHEVPRAVGGPCALSSQHDSHEEHRGNDKTVREEYRSSLCAGRPGSVRGSQPLTKPLGRKWYGVKKGKWYNLTYCWPQELLCIGSSVYVCLYIKLKESKRETRDVSQSEQCLPSTGSIPTLHKPDTPVNPVLERWRQVDQEFMVTLSYRVVSQRLAWTT